MRRVWLFKEDFGLFHQDITPQEYEFFRTHAGAFKRMWNEQSRRFWSLFVNAFEYFIWNYGVMKDFPMKVEEVREYIDELVFYIRDQFVDGRISTARNLVMDCVIVTQNRHCIALLDKASYAQNPFYKKETREIFRQLFGPPDDRRTFMKVLCGLPVYIKFAGAVVAVLRRWLTAEDIPSDETMEAEFLANVHSRTYPSQLSLEYDQNLLQSVSILGADGPKLLNAVSRGVEVKSSVDSVSASAEEEQAAAGLKKKRKKKKKKSSQPELPSPGVAKELEGGGGGESGGVVKTEKTQNIESGNVCDGAGSKDTAMGLHSGGIETSSRGSCTAAETPPTTTTTTTTTTNTPSSDDVNEAELVAKEENVDESNVDKGRGSAKQQNMAAGMEERRKKLHVCAHCAKAETAAKSFKRCQMCRGKPNPKYYCSKECQTKHWKLHKQDHKENQKSMANGSPV